MVEHDTTSHGGTEYDNISADEKILDDNKVPTTVGMSFWAWHIKNNDEYDTLNNERTNRDSRLLQCTNSSNNTDAGIPAVRAMDAPRWHGALRLWINTG